MMRLLGGLAVIGAASTLGLGFVLVSTVQAHGQTFQTASAIECNEFIDQAEAQRFFDAKGGTVNDIYQLDQNDDGIACEPGPIPTPVSREHAENCEQWLDYLVDNPEADGSRYREECRDYREQTGRIRRCPAYEGLSYRFFSGLSPDQIDGLSDMQSSEYSSIMSYGEGECVPVDVARTSAWQCQPLAYYIGEFEEGTESLMGDKSYYTDELTERYRVVCLGHEVDLDDSRTFSIEYLVGSGLAGAAAIWLYFRYKRNARSTEDDAAE